jgi:DNA-binding IclR family transcriptional regulator
MTETTDRPPTDDENSVATTQYVDRTLKLLIALGESPGGGAGVSALAAQLQMSKTTVYRLLQSLLRHGFVSYLPDVRRYRLGERIIGLGLRAQERLEIRNEVRPFLYDLRDRTGESTALEVVLGRDHITIEQAVTHRQPRAVFRLGGFHPLHQAAVGRLLLAYQDDEFIRRYLAEMPLNEDRRFSRVDPEELRREVPIIRRQRYAISVGTSLPGWNGVAFPLVNSDFDLLGAITIVGPAERWSPEEMNAHLSACQAVVDEVNLRLRHMRPLHL